MISKAPLSVTVRRNGHWESEHEVDVIAVNAVGDVSLSYGIVDRLVFPRSAVKFLQTLPLIESGAQNAFGLGADHIAVACASHNGEPVHTELVANWLRAIGSSEAQLECGCHAPHDVDTAHSLIRSQQSANQLHNNCSGKHAGVISTCIHLGEKVAGYSDINHVVQQWIKEIFEDFSDTKLSADMWGVDGCSMPAVRLPLHSLALMLARFADPSRTPRDAKSPRGRGIDLKGKNAVPRAEAIVRIHRALETHPYLIAGRDRLCTDVIEKTSGSVLAKVGAEGVYVACCPKVGGGVAIKVRDGTGRASEIALISVLKKLGWINESIFNQLRAGVGTSIKSWRGAVVGDIIVTGL